MISVVVTTYNRPDALAAVLAGLAAQRDRDFEVIVADDGSRPDTAELVAGLPCSVVSLTQAGRARLPEPGQLLAAGDVVHVAATHEGASALDRRLGEA